MSAIYKKYRREWSTLVALLITFVLFSALEPSYLSATNVATIITPVSYTHLDVYKRQLYGNRYPADGIP